MKTAFAAFSVYLLITLLQAVPDPGPLREVQMTLGTKSYTLEVADSPDARARGLMYRKSMPEDHGMIFIFDDEKPRSFWMKNTYIPLDIIYLTSAGKVVSVRPLRPLDERSVPSMGPARYAIELNRGQAAAAGIKPGDVLTLPDLSVVEGVKVGQ